MSNLVWLCDRGRVEDTHKGVLDSLDLEPYKLDASSLGLLVILSIWAYSPASQG